MSKIFTFEGRRYKYFPSGSDRTIEVPIAAEAARRHSAKGNKILEVGRVLPRYYKFKETVVDKFEGPIKEDILTWKPPHEFNLIISISTVEHIWWDELKSYKPWGGSIPRTAGKSTEAIHRMLTFLARGGEMLCTWPIAHNPPLDADLFAGKFPTAHVAYMRRISHKTNQWTMSNEAEAKVAKMWKPFPAGNVVAIVRWRN